MRRLLISACVALLGLSAFAQQIPQGLGFQIGFAEPILRLNSPTASNKDTLINSTKMNGVKLGLVYDATYIKGFGLSLGLNYTLAGRTGSWEKSSGIADYPQTKTAILYNELEIVADWQYKFEIAKETYLVLYTGPSIQCGLSLKNKVYKKEFSDQAATLDKQYDRYTNDAELIRQLNRLNITWGIGAGFQYGRYFLRGGYDFGLINPYRIRNFNEVSDSYDRYTRGRLDQWSVKAGIYFWYK